MRLKAEIWVQAHLRRCAGEGIPGVVVRRGDRDAGAIYIKVLALDGTCWLYGPAPTGLDESRYERFWVACLGPDPVPEQDADAFLTRQISYDSDIWLIELEDANGRHLLQEALLRHL